MLYPAQEEALIVLVSGANVVLATPTGSGKSLVATDALYVTTKEDKAAIAEHIGRFRFSTAFGSTLSRLVRHGIGVHHAGMLPKYRRLVEQLAQAGLLTVICGTDTLGVGINVPIRTVVFSALSKYDGTRTRLLNAREFHQIAGRAGRAGYDTAGTVVVQAPDFALNQPLSTFALAAVDVLDPASGTYARDVVSVIEATLEDPRQILAAQLNKARGEAVAQMKAEGIEYDERIELLDEVTYPRPLDELLGHTFEVYLRSNPWAADGGLSPKSVVREMWERALTFREFVTVYGLTRSEGADARPGAADHRPPARHMAGAADPGRPGPKPLHALKNSRRSVLIVSVCVVGMPCGNPS